MKAVIYARYSSDRQREESITSQLRVCNDYAKRNSITIVKEYIDRAISGKSADNRPEFLRMISDSDRHLFDAVIVYRLDRFARNRYDSAMFRAKLKKNNVIVLSAMEQLSDNPESIILESVLEGMAEYYSIELSQKVKRGMHENALQCKSTGGRIPLGYAIGESGAYVIQESSAEIVREIFTNFIEGKNPSIIIQELNMRGCRTSMGLAFKKSSLFSILSNKRYAGIYTYDGVNIAGGVPRIVDQKTFDTAQQMLSARQRSSPRLKGSVEYLLTSKLYCGDCNALMVGESGTGRGGRTYNYYKCNNNKFKKECAKTPIQKEWIERLVVEETKKQILVPEQIERISERCVEILEQERRDSSILTTLTRELVANKKSIANLLKMAERVVSESLNDRLNVLELQKNDLEMRIAEEKLSKPVLSKKQIMFWLESFMDGSVDDDSYKKQIINTLVRRVIAYEDKIVIEYNVSGLDNGVQSSVTRGSDSNAMLHQTCIYPNLSCGGKLFYLIIDL